MVSMCAARYRWERFLGITLAMHHKMDVNMAQFFDYFNECSLRIFSCWNVQMILNVSCKSGHVRLNCLRTFRNCQSKNSNLKIWLIGQYSWLIGQYRWLLCQFQLQLQISTILSHGMLEVVATRHRLQRLWGRIVTSIFWNQIKSTQILTKQAPKANENFLTPQHFLSVTVSRLNQSYNFKGTCNLSRNLCNHVNFVFVVTTCSSVESVSQSIRAVRAVRAVRASPRFNSPIELSERRSLSDL